MAQAQRPHAPGEFQFVLDESEAPCAESHRRLSSGAFEVDNRVRNLDQKISDGIEQLAKRIGASNRDLTTILIFGPPGVGKSHLGSGIGHALIDVGYRVLLMRTSEMVQRLQAARQSLQLPAVLAKRDRFDLLILDDISYVSERIRPKPVCYSN